MDKLFLICIDDQREILAALSKELNEFREFLEIIDCESASEAKEEIENIAGMGGELALVICDHVMPGQTGVEFLSELRKDPRFPLTRQILLTGLATQQDTIEAINQARINRYIEKPWQKENLVSEIKILITKFIFEAGIEYAPFLSMLDQKTMYSSLRNQG